MADNIRNTQQYLEAAESVTASNARETQQYLEVTENVVASNARETQAYLEVAYTYADAPDPPDPPAGSGIFHGRRGRSFQLDYSFRLPIEERLFDAPTKGSGAPATPDVNFNPPHGYDEALDECFVIPQKGGDRTAPMSWALAVVNIGTGVTTSAPSSRPSNYGLCFIWFDAPGWGQNAPASMKYNLTNGQDPVIGGDSQYSTQAFRAILIHKFIEPGKRYNVAVQLQLDSGTPGQSGTPTDWNSDGFFKVWVSEDGNEPTVYSAVDSGRALTPSGMEVYKGPQDSLLYLIKYGIRYSARDATFLGLGFRSHVWKKASFIPWGADAAPLKYGGYRMIDRSAHTITEIYGGAVHTLTINKAALGDAYVTVNHRGLANGNTNGGTAPMGFFGGSDYLFWAGYNAAAAAGAPFNPEALRNYRLVTTGDFTDGTPDAKGMILNILSYAETPGFRLTIQNGSSIGAFSQAWPALVQAFRWNQREVEVSEVRIWSEPRAFDDADPLLASRRKLSLKRGSIRLDDQTEPDIETLQFYMPCDDAGGSVLRELVGGQVGFLAPLGLGITPGDRR